ncbi:potassium channel family protein [Methanoregula sp. UBA64]|jgi:voltage-gated potassium channel|uniref:potassium channel family protein n=1 Tax=Methanoregula sp. UBA64 TaxID=1915554 RepID=UPI0025CD313B|nr:NAD-binding protein [Methanoregula sp. UBA64]
MNDKKSILWRIFRTSSEMRILIYFILFCLMILVFTVIFHDLYPLYEGIPVDWSESFLYVIQTFTTTGSLLPITTDEMTIFSSVTMLTGVVMLFMVIPLLLTPYLIEVLRSSPPKKISKKLSHHVVIVGDGELTRALLESLALCEKDILIVIGDEETARQVVKKYRRRAFVMWGKYDDPHTWELAGVKNAGFVILCEDERTTASIILGIRALTAARLIAIVDKISFDLYLKYAGADYVVSPKHVTGRILARHAVLNPGGDETEPAIPGLDRLHIGDEDAGEKKLRLIHIPVMPESKAVGKTLGELDLFGRYGISAPFLWRAGRTHPSDNPEAGTFEKRQAASPQFIADPAMTEVIDPVTSLFLFGTAEALRRAVREELEVDRELIGHAVIAGYGDVGSAACTEMIASGISCVVVDAKKHDLDEVIGNAEDEDVLREARIGEARFCIVAVNDDHVNIFTTLMARNLNPGIRILARANEPGSVEKLYRAGADYVTLLPRIGGQTIGRIVLADTVTVLVDLPDRERVILRQVRHKKTLSVGEIRATGVRVLGIERTDTAIIAPGTDEIVHPGDTIVAAGSTEQLKKFIRQC